MNINNSQKQTNIINGIDYKDHTFENLYVDSTKNPDTALFYYPIII